MCLIVFAHNIHPKYKLILAANRDEFYNRPTRPAAWWQDHPMILGGRDLAAMGTWMGISKKGRFAAVTNYRDLKNIKKDTKTRGDLPTDFLSGTESPESYVRRIHQQGSLYNGFNLIVMDEEMAYASNYHDETYDLNFGLFGLSNALLDEPWPKVEKAKEKLNGLIQKKFSLEDLIELIGDDCTAPDASLPDTGLSYMREKALSAMHIETPDYGTCCSTGIRIDYEGNVEFIEKNFPVGSRSEAVISFQFKTID